MLDTPNRDERQAFVFSGTIRHETERGLLIVPRGLREPLWFQRRLTRVLGCDQFAVPLWLARQKFPEEALATGGESTRPRSAA
jgi:hypothetical protein